MTTSLVTEPIERRPEFAGILRDEQIYSTGRADDAAERINGWFDRLMIQSGLNVSPPVMLLLCLLGTITLGGGVFVLQENLLTTGLAAALGGAAPLLTAVVQRNRRQMQMLRQMPGMVGELARAARTGRNLEQCFLTVAADTPVPLGSELRLCARKMQMGVGVGAAVRELPERTGLVSANVLVTALTVHQQTGGDLVRVLERLAQTIRDRLTFLGRIRAATAASRATAVLMVALPPLILAFFLMRDPAYFTNLMASRWGRIATGISITLQLIGTAWIVRILKNSRRT